MTKSPGCPQYLDVSDPDRPPGTGLAAFDEIYEREFDYVCRSLGRLGVPTADIPDAVHDVFVVLYRRWHDIDRERTLRPWLFGVARRIAAALRAKRRETEPLDEVLVVDDPRRGERDRLWRALHELDEDKRVVIILHELEGHSGSEIAALLEIPVNTVHSRLRLARRELLEIIHGKRGKR